MPAPAASPWKRFWSYVGYGVGAVIALVIPLVAIQWLVQNIPFVESSPWGSWRPYSCSPYSAGCSGATYGTPSRRRPS